MNAGEATVRYAFHMRRAGAGAPLMRAGAEPEVAAPQGRVPRVARLLALAHKFQGMLNRGEVASMANLARLGKVTRARMTQIMDLLLLAPDIQEEVLHLPPVFSGEDTVTMRELQGVARAVAWGEQRRRWRSSTRCQPPRVGSSNGLP